MIQRSTLSLGLPIARWRGGRFDRLVLRRAAGTLNSNQVLLAALTITGQLCLASNALAPDAKIAPDGGSSLCLLLPYSAVMLGFLSSYWGLWTSPEAADNRAAYSPRRAALAERRRLIASLAPTIMGGSSLLMPVVLPAEAGVLMLIAGFLLVFALELIGSRQKMPIAGFPGLRWTVTVASVAILLNVATLRLWDFSLFF